MSMNSSSKLGFLMHAARTKKLSISRTWLDCIPVLKTHASHAAVIMCLQHAESSKEYVIEKRVRNKRVL